LRRLSYSPEERYCRRMMTFQPELKTEICTPEFLEASGDEGIAPFLLNAFGTSDADTFLDAVLDVDVTYYLTDCLLVKVDIATMAHALEGRSPMLDHEFMEFAASLPADFKLRDRQTKYIFKRAVRNLLPEEIIDRPKQGFSVPLEQWFRKDLRDISADMLLDGRLAQRGYFKPGAVRRLLEEHWRGSVSWHNHLWTLLMLESWHRMFIDERPTSKPIASSAEMVVA
jgi:asparagine synthase (glutamine-hydrolysing)